MSRNSRHQRDRAGFTLTEMLVAIAILAIISVVLITMLERVSAAYRFTTGKIEQFAQARAAFATITERLSNATLNPYFDYDSFTKPTKYIRQSELRFICGQASEVIDNGVAYTEKHYTHAIFFNVPLGFVSDQKNLGQLNTAINSDGYFIEYGSNASFQPTFLTALGAPAPTRFRLMEFTEPSDQLSIYSYTSGLSSGANPVAKTFTYATKPPLTGLNPASQFSNVNGSGREWFLKSLYTQGTSHVAADSFHILANNVIALVLLPKISPENETKAGIPIGTALAPFYSYDSTGDSTQKPAPRGQIYPGDVQDLNQLPPIVQVTMVAIDELSATRLAGNAANLATLQNTLGGLFQNAKDYTTDMTTLQNQLQALHINYRVFSTDVYLKESKWSRSQN